MIKIVSAERFYSDKRTIFKGLHHILYKGVPIASARKAKVENSWLVTPYNQTGGKIRVIMTVEEIEDMARRCER